ncbi:MAG: alanine racemase [Patescibacteria group bacterium]
MHSKKAAPFKTWVEVSRASLTENLKTLKKVVGTKTKVACVIKANAYGHGILEVAKILEGEGVDFFAVDNTQEALLLKNSGISTPILILGYIELSDLKEAIMSDFSFVSYNQETLRKIISLSLPKPAKVHLKMETGLNRQGIDRKEIPLFTAMIKKAPKHILLEGISTHFANIEDTLDPSFAERQIEGFREALKPVLSWRSIVAQVKEIKAGESVGYGRTWYAPRKSKIAIIPVGYSDGYDRKLSNSSRVIIKGKFAPIIGRVAMNMIVADVTEIAGVNIEDEVTLIGKSKGKEISAEELAQNTNTINYEVVSRINPLLPRIIV